MRLAQSLKIFVGSVAVYVITAACSAGSTADHGDGGTPGLAGVVDAMAEGVVDPVPTASAATPPEVATESCAKSYTCAAGVQCKYAEHLYPGASATDLAAQVMAVAPTGSPEPSGYSLGQTLLFYRDGAVAAYCPSGSSVTFVRRQ